MPKLFTIGYEKAKPIAVLDELKRAKVRVLVDVRAVAASRRPGFSKRQLAATLDERGISYVHLQKLGTPAAGRSANHAGDMKKFWSIYEKHLATAAAKHEIEELVALVRAGKPVCLLCYERDVESCHRKRIAEIVHKRTKAGIANLAAPLF
jgi:uncharacterized protein (DUF488 family)